MNTCEDPGSRVGKRFEEMLERVRSMKREGDLEEWIQSEIEGMKRLLHEEALAERARIEASEEADFPPSGMPGVREGDGQPAPEKSNGPDGERSG